jgi:hypothetical protein
MHDLTIKQLVRLRENINRRIWKRFEGGLVFGVDMSTLHVVAPGLGASLDVVNHEIADRMNALYSRLPRAFTSVS